MLIPKQQKQLANFLTSTGLPQLNAHVTGNIISVDGRQLYDHEALALALHHMLPGIDKNKIGDALCNIFTHQ